MNSTINMPAIFIANAMGLIILFVIAVGNSWRARSASRRNRYLKILFAACLVSCIADPICFYADGKPGAFNRFLVIGGNTWLYLSGLIIAIAWILLVADSINVTLSPVHRWVIRICGSIVALLIISNLFTPILFAVDENNIYARTGIYGLYTASYLCLMVDGLVLYLRKHQESGKLKFFPVWAFIVPAALGILVQNLFYGVSTVTPFITVSLTCIVISFQNEFLFRDKLTGLYNRFYLNALDRKLGQRSHRTYTAVMLDINRFKEINDTYGHKMGDHALQQFADILTRAVNQMGEVIRYAGDEFILILNTQDDASTKVILARIQQELDALNKSGTVPYRLTVASGFYTLRFGEVSMDEFVDEIDKRMYDNKREYYLTHEQYDRRKGPPHRQ